MREDGMGHRRDVIGLPAKSGENARCLFGRQPRGLCAQRRVLLDRHAIMQQDRGRENGTVSALLRMNAHGITKDAQDMSDVMRAVVGFASMGISWAASFSCGLKASARSDMGTPDGYQEEVSPAASAFNPFSTPASGPLSEAGFSIVRKTF